MKRGGLYTPAWRSPTDADRKLGVMTSHDLAGNEGRSLLARHDGRVVPVCVHIEDNGLCDDDADEDDNDRLAATNGDETRRLTDCDRRVEQPGVQRSRSPPSTSSSVSGDLQGYDDCNLNTSVYDLPHELDGGRGSVVPRRRVQSESSSERRPSRVEDLASEALTAVVRSCRGPPSSPRRDDVVDDVDRLSTVSAPAVFVVTDTKQLVIFTVDRTPLRCTAAVAPVVRVPPLSHSDHTLNR